MFAEKRRNGWKMTSFFKGNAFFFSLEKRREIEKVVFSEKGKRDIGHRE